MLALLVVQEGVVVEGQQACICNAVDALRDRLNKKSA